MTHPPHIIEVVRRMKGERASNKMIAMSIGETQGAVEWLCHKHNIRRPPSGRIEIGLATHSAFQAEAVKRGLTTEGLLRKVLRTVAVDNLFAAVLDDGK